MLFSFKERMRAGIQGREGFVGHHSRVQKKGFLVRWFLVAKERRKERKGRKEEVPLDGSEILRGKGIQLKS